MIPYSRQFISKKDKSFVLKALSSDFLTTGPLVKKFEDELSKKFNVKYAVVVNSATTGLHISTLALNFREKDMLWTSPISFVASSNCSLYCNGKVDFVDIDDQTYNISIDDLIEKLKKIKNKKKFPKIVVPVHLGGNPSEMKQLKKLSTKYGFKIIEDASHAAGSRIGQSKIGSCRYSDITVFSFHPVKPFTTAEGGAVLTNSKKIYKKLLLYRNQGMQRFKNPMYYDVVRLGYNYRLSDIQSALGISQLKSLNKFLVKRNNIAKYYIKNISSKVRFQYISPYNYSSFHLFIIRVPKKIRSLLIQKLLKSKIKTNLHYIPIYKFKIYKKFKFNMKNFKNSEKYYKEALSIPAYYGLKTSQQKKIVKIINSFF